MDLLRIPYNSPDLNTNMWGSYKSNATSFGAIKMTWMQKLKGSTHPSQNPTRRFLFRKQVSMSYQITRCADSISNLFFFFMSEWDHIYLSEHIYLYLVMWCDRLNTPLTFKWLTEELWCLYIIKNPSCYLFTRSEPKNIFFSTSLGFCLLSEDCHWFCGFDV